MATNGNSKITFIIILGIVIFILAVIAIFKINAWYDLKIRRELAEKKCKEYTKFGCDNAIKGREAVSNESSPIIGGTFAYDGQFPHMASLFMRFANKELGLGAQCGGTLISEYFVMTAGHCVAETAKAQDIVLKMGSIDSIEIPRSGEMFRVSKIYKHPGYNPKHVLNDIALLKLNRRVVFGPYIRPICLNTALEGNLKNITGSGWGITSKDLDLDTRSNKLLFVDLYIDNEAVKSACIEQFGRTRIEEYGICAGNPQRFKTEAQGDSGGPLQITKACVNTYEQIGIASFVSTDRKILELWPTMYTKVEDFIPWIVDIVWPDEL